MNKEGGMTMTPRMKDQSVTPGVNRSVVQVLSMGIQQRFINLAAMIIESGLQSKNQSDLEAMAGQLDADLFISVLNAGAGAIPLDANPDRKRLLRRSLNRLQFEQMVKDCGVLTSAETAKLLGISKVAVKQKKDRGQLLAVRVGRDDVYPTFQLTGQKETPIARGMTELLAQLKDISDVMRYSFFTQKRTMLDKRVPEYRVCDLISAGIQDEELASVIRLASLVASGDQD
jgi:predicted transcriptional regulator